MTQAFRILAIAGGIMWLRAITRWMRQKPARNTRAASIFGREERT